MITNPNKTAANRTLGRPSAEDAREVRAELLESARELFIQHGFDGVSTKRIAERAGVNPAMINYYFGGKVGLHEAMLQQAIAPALERLARLADEPNNAEPTVRGILSTYMETMAANPWLPPLIVREVLAEGGRLREAFIGAAAGRAGALITALVKRGQARGELRADMDPTLVALSLVSLAIFPFVGAPVAGRVLGYEIDDAFVERLVDHTVELFHQGAAIGSTAESSRRTGE